MKKVIKLLLRADHKVTSEDLYRADHFRWRASTKKLLAQAIDLLQSPPRWETPEQYKERTGEDWPDEAAVYIYGECYDYSWSVCRYITAKEWRYFCICANMAGPPPADWKPEEVENDK
jgi:hypothetical protein